MACIRDKGWILGLSFAFSTSYRFWINSAPGFTLAIGLHVLHIGAPVSEVEEKARCDREFRSEVGEVVVGLLLHRLPLFVGEGEMVFAGLSKLCHTGAEFRDGVSSHGTSW